MPTYINRDIAKNPGKQSITYNGESFKWNEQKAVPFFVPEEKGLELLSTDPKVEPVCLKAGEISLSGSEERIYIPDCQYFVASFKVMSGDAQLRHNYADAPEIPIGPNNGYTLAAPRADVERFILTGTAVVRYLIERVTRL